MMFHRTGAALVAALLSGVATPAIAADFYEPPVAEAPPAIVQNDALYGGWYIRGDIDYHAADFEGADYIRYGSPGEPGKLYGDLDDSWSLGVGVGYQVSKHFRTDLTFDYLGESDFSGYTIGECL